MDVDLREGSGACTFCGIVEGRIPCLEVFADAHALAFLDHRPIVHGHCLVIPRVHYPTLLDLPPEALASLFGAAQRVSRGMMRGLGADGSFLAVNTIVSQSVPHVHLHVIPRWRKDGFFSRPLWARRPYRDEEEARRVQAAIRHATEG